MKRVLITAVATVLLTTNAYAFRCSPSGLVKEGYTKAQVLRACGSPALSEVTGVKKCGRSYRKVVEWTYVLKKYGHREVYLIRFGCGGKADYIKYLGR